MRATYPHIISIVFAAMALLVSCDKQQSDTPEEIAKMFILSLHHDKPAITHGTIYSFLDAPKEYKEMILARYREITNNIETENGKITDIKCTKTELHSGGNQADVYLSITHADKTTNHIMIPLIKHNRHWLVR